MKRPRTDIRTPVPPAPMLATAGQPPVGDDWIVEPKFDGARCAARIGGGRAELFSRQANNVSAAFPDVVSGCSALSGRDVILDGEIVVLDDRTRPSFQLLQRRLPVARPPQSLQRRLPARLVVFDVLHLDGHDLTSLPYRERRGILQDLDFAVAAPALSMSPAWAGLDGRDVLKAMVDAGMEGVVCKRAGSSYWSGRRSRQWIKTPYRHSGHFVVGGYAASAAGAVNALLVGAYDQAGHLTYCGTVTIGFTDRARRDMGAALAQLRRVVSPFRSVATSLDESRICWVEPLVVGRVEFREYTGRLRHAAWKGVVAVDADAVCVPALT
ncbi:non-homologous end-joining DNA ligase [Mycolicibacterium tokaiense]|nr:non-homologous end-joining DNA ligase [Mycolicibacterium tokaiense]